MNHPKPLVNEVLNPSDSRFSKVSSRKRANKKQDPQDLAKKTNSSNSFENLGKQAGQSVDSRSHEGNFSKSEIGQPSRLPSCPSIAQDLHIGNLQQTARPEVEVMDTSL